MGVRRREISRTSRKPSVVISAVLSPFPFQDSVGGDGEAMTYFRNVFGRNTEVFDALSEAIQYRATVIVWGAGNFFYQHRAIGAQEYYICKRAADVNSGSKPSHSVCSFQSEDERLLRIFLLEAVPNHIISRLFDIAALFIQQEG